MFKNKIYYRSLYFFVSLFILFVIGIEKAGAGAFSFNAASIDWTTFNISSPDGATFDLYEEISNSYAYVKQYEPILLEDGGITDEGNGWVNTSSEALVNNSSANADSFINDPNIPNSLNGITKIDADGINTTDAWSEASSKFQGRLTMKTDGTITISVNYYLDQIIDNDSSLFGSEGYSEASLDITSVNKGYFFDLKQLENNISGIGSQNWSEDGILTISHFFNANEDVRFNADVRTESSAYSQVPEPGTIMLMLSGIVVLMVFGTFNKVTKNI